MSNSQPIQKTAVILNSSTNWDKWLEIVKTKAIRGEIWSFVDPAIEKDKLSTLKQPDVPTTAIVNSDKIKFSELSKDEKEELKLLQFTYKYSLTQYECQKTSLTSFQSFIQETVSQTNLLYTFKQDMPYDMLITLKQCIVPIDEARELELAK